MIKIEEGQTVDQAIEVQPEDDDHTQKIKSDLQKIRAEKAAYETMRKELERDHLGKYAVVRDKKLLEVFNDFREAWIAAAKKYGVGRDTHYLIRRVGPDQPPFILPSSVQFGLLFSTA
ncbi:MAG: hypothetical protein OXI94_12250 [Gemmatimonadota bacterium]|nr:hypothetical protein [Gemmatimonadota bacterium]